MEETAVDVVVLIFLRVSRSPPNILVLPTRT